MEQASVGSMRRVQRVIRGRNLTPTEGGTIYAYGNQGRWVADCPCHGAELVAEGQPMVCGTCAATHQVVFPAERVEIDAVLDKRPPANQNWYPGETVAQLKAENVTKGVN